AAPGRREGAALQLRRRQRRRPRRQPRRRREGGELQGLRRRGQRGRGPHRPAQVRRGDRRRGVDRLQRRARAGHARRQADGDLPRRHGPRRGGSRYRRQAEAGAGVCAARGLRRRRDPAAGREPGARQAVPDLGDRPGQRRRVPLHGEPGRRLRADELPPRPRLVPAAFREAPGDALPTLFTSMFLHGGWAHLLSNMVFLVVFADNVEDRFGRLRFLVFYLVGGAFATLAHALFSRESLVPLVGASGAISAVLGAYISLFPRQQVLTFVPPLFVPWLVLSFLARVPRFFLFWLPAWVFIGYWALLQVLEAGASLGMSVQEGG